MIGTEDLADISRHPTYRRGQRLVRCLLIAGFSSVVLLAVTSVLESCLQQSPQNAGSSSSRVELEGGEFQVIGWSQEQVEDTEKKLAQRLLKLSRAFSLTDGKSISMQAKLAQAQAHLDALRPQVSRMDLHHLKIPAKTQEVLSLHGIKQKIEGFYQRLRAESKARDRALLKLASGISSFRDETEHKVATRLADVINTTLDQHKLRAVLDTDDVKYRELIGHGIRNFSNEISQTGKSVEYEIFRSNGPWFHHDDAVNKTLSSGIQNVKNKWIKFVEKTMKPILEMDAAVNIFATNLSSWIVNVDDATTNLNRSQYNLTLGACRSFWAIVSQMVVENEDSKLIQPEAHHLLNNEKRRMDPCFDAAETAHQMDKLISMLLKRIAQAILEEAQHAHEEATTKADYLNVTASFRLEQWKRALTGRKFQSTAFRRHVEVEAVHKGHQILEEVKMARVRQLAELLDDRAFILQLIEMLLEGKLSRQGAEQRAVSGSTLTAASVEDVPASLRGVALMLLQMLQGVDGRVAEVRQQLAREEAIVAAHEGKEAALLLRERAAAVELRAATARAREDEAESTLKAGELAYVSEASPPARALLLRELTALKEQLDAARLAARQSLFVMNASCPAGAAGRGGAWGEGAGEAETGWEWAAAADNGTDAGRRNASLEFMQWCEARLGPVLYSDERVAAPAPADLAELLRLLHGLSVPWARWVPEVSPLRGPLGGAGAAGAAGGEEGGGVGGAAAADGWGSGVWES